MHIKAKQTGFTLLEVLIAMAISVLIYMGSYTLLDSVLITDSAVKSKRVALEELQRSMMIMQRDIEQIIPRSVSNGTSQEVALEYDGVSDKLTFTRNGWRNPVGRMRSNMQRVSYSLEDETLYREHWLSLDRPLSVEAKKNALLKQVKDVRYRFFELSSQQWRSEWQKQLGDKEALPAAIEISLIDTGLGDLRRVFLLVENKDLQYDEQQ